LKRLGAALVILALTLVLVSGPGTASARASGVSTVAPWIRLELDTIRSQRLNPPRASRALAHLSAAMHLAALSGESGRDDAVAGAASVVARYLHPDAAAQIDALAADVADTGSRAFARGRLAGQVLVVRARNDRSDAVWTGTPPQGEQYWVPTPPGYVHPPLEPLAGNWLTWNIRDGSQFRPGPPPAYGSPQFLAEMHEVYDVSQTLSEEQKRIADYWADGAGTVTPPGHWNQIALDEPALSGWSTLQVTRLFAALNTAQADAFIACWDAKYAYWSVRPVTAIRRLIDPNWLSYIVTPPFPSYVSGHSTTSSAAATVLGGFFPSSATHFQAMVEEAAISRLYGGFHYRSDNEAGLELGRKVGSAALHIYL
jgi:hypothetical protein